MVKDIISRYTLDGWPFKPQNDGDISELSENTLDDYNEKIVLYLQLKAGRIPIQFTALLMTSNPALINRLIRI